jgi:hypothetical protein
LETTITALKKVINEKQGEIERQKKSLQELESRNAKLVRESIITPPATPIPPKVDLQVAALERTIQEQEGRIDRQKIQLFNLQKQNTNLKKDAMDKRSQQNASKPRQVGVGQGQARRARGEAGRRRAEVASGGASGKSDGQIHREPPPHMSGTGTGDRGSTDHNVKSNVIHWEDIPALYGGSSQQADSAAGSSTGSKPGRNANNTSKTRTGANRVDINTRSLLDRMCRQRSDDEQRMMQEQGSVEGQVIGRGGSWDNEQSEGGPSNSSGGYEENSLEPGGGWGSDNPGGDGWGYCVPGHEYAGQVDTGEDIYVNAIPVEDDWSDNPLAPEQWGHEDGGEHWDQYHAQAARSQPGSTSSSW